MARRKFPKLPFGDYNYSNQHPCRGEGELQGYLTRIGSSNWAYWCPCGFAGEGAISESKAKSWIAWHVARGKGTMTAPPITVGRDEFLALLYPVTPAH